MAGVFYLANLSCLGRFIKRYIRPAVWLPAGVILKPGFRAAAWGSFLFF